MEQDSDARVLLKIIHVARTDSKIDQRLLYPPLLPRVAILSNGGGSDTQLNGGGHFTATTLFCADTKSCWQLPRPPRQSWCCLSWRTGAVRGITTLETRTSPSVTHTEGVCLHEQLFSTRTLSRLNILSPPPAHLNLS